MFWFNRNKQPTPYTRLQKNTAIEIVAHRNAKHEAVEEVKQANEQLNKLLIGNGFTLKIYLAAGGSHPKRQVGKT